MLYSTIVEIKIKLESSFHFFFQVCFVIAVSLYGNQTGTVFQNSHGFNVSTETSLTKRDNKQIAK